ncbi:MAG TPA: aminotransferase class V-fold PLP-dependent enzyme [Tepidisphaeraceae bacterium]|nr:aminotransferase class V-fold PLP-dependent enzyme [Tepidisphaeraceae bacterium]
MSVIQPPVPIRADLRAEWLLDPRVTFLNHGSFGALPRCVFEEQTRWRLRVEAEPIEILGRRSAELLRDSRRAVGEWLGMEEGDFGLVTNATEGINAVLRSMKLRTGDELLTTTHVYNAVRQSMKYTAALAGATYREIDVPLPVRSAEEIAERVLGGVSDRTRLLVVDHISSPTALVFPVERISAECARRGVDVLVDGAHAPGMVPLQVPLVGSAYYAGNLHKWASAPKGSGFLWVRKDRQADVHPLVISHHLGEGFAREFEWQGTRDISGWLAIPRGLQFMAGLGWDAVMSHNHQMATWVQQTLCERWGVDPISPLDGSMLGSMATVRLPESLARLDEAAVRTLQQQLYTEHRIEVPIMQWSGRNFVRPCCQVYNEPAEYRRLAEVIQQVAREH